MGKKQLNGIDLSLTVVNGGEKHLYIFETHQQSYEAIPKVKTSKTPVCLNAKYVIAALTQKHFMVFWMLNDYR